MNILTTVFGKGIRGTVFENVLMSPQSLKKQETKLLSTGYG